MLGWFLVVIGLALLERVGIDAPLAVALVLGLMWSWEERLEARHLWWLFGVGLVMDVIMLDAIGSRAVMLLLMVGVVEGVRGKFDNYMAWAVGSSLGFLGIWEVVVGGGFRVENILVGAVMVSGWLAILRGTRTGGGRGVVVKNRG